MYQPKISEITKLRKSTNSGIKDCKKAMIESNGNFEKAIDWLRKKGVADAYFKKTNEGFVICKINKKKTIGVLLKISCETDFVTKNSTFLKMAKIIANNAIFCKSKDELLLFQIKKNLSVKEMINHHINNIIKEQIKLISFERIQSEFVGYYVHHSNKIGSIVGFYKKIKEIQGIEAISKEIAMQIVATNPIGLEKKDIPRDVIKREKNIIINNLLFKNQSINLIKKIIIGKLNKFFNENVLLDQNLITDKKIYIKKFIKNLKISSYKRIS
ncbi:translation elongation factor Ts [Candidatus Sulcia muelleri]|uniref:translation elongation factor Ts n=1 Tax=Candidatus Karelsulcia muelleri TaxID=336810 RepID=UPI001F87C062|nr:translation elongation factor Ts [Candidatus Karelsulcia muelleri]NHU72392.1 translation elongation factor Ts [Candidatus Karelsulcia muelleri]